MKKILIPVDFSECSVPAIKFSKTLAQKTGAELYFIHVLELPGSNVTRMETGEWSFSDDLTSGDVPLMMFLLKETKSKMENLIEESELDGINVKHNIEVGSPGERIVDAAKKYEADMIVMGTHGSSGWNELFVGSNAEKVVRMADRPVLAIKKEINHDPNNIVFASDFADEVDNIFPQVKTFAEIFKSKVHLLKVNTLDNFESTRADQERIAKFKNKHNVPDYPVSIYSDQLKEAGILHFAKELNADMIILGTHGRRGFARFFMESISEELVNHSFCPVMTINFKK